MAIIALHKNKIGDMDITKLIIMAYAYSAPLRVTREKGEGGNYSR
jgi:hypothetical protein